MNTTIITVPVEVGDPDVEERDVVEAGPGGEGGDGQGGAVHSGFCSFTYAVCLTREKMRNVEMGFAVESCLDPMRLLVEVNHVVAFFL